MAADPVQKIVILGGGTAGWMFAAAAARFLAGAGRQITLIESDQIGRVGVGEATIPPIVNFLRMVGVSEAELLTRCEASFKLGIEFENWGAIGERYMHPFGGIGHDFNGVGFHQYWLRMRGEEATGSLTDYSLSTLAAHAGKFGVSGDPRSPLSQIGHAYHFDASLLAGVLRDHAERGGVRRVEGKLAQVHRDSESGFVTALELEDGSRHEGDLFIDCSGFRSLLLGEACGVAYEDWSDLLVCDRALAVPSARLPQLRPFTRSIAHGSGWQWQIPLQHRTGNGLVYSSRHLSDDEAHCLLLSQIEGEPLADPMPIRFTAGMREKAWEHNVIGLGLSGGFIEPLESTSIHLIQTAISKLFWLFPDKACSAVERDEFNQLMAEQYAYIRDFIVLHYKATRRDDTPFWREMAALPVPESLERKLRLFREKGRVKRYDHDLFAVNSWVSVFLGQGIIPDGHDPLADAMPEDQLRATLAKLRQAFANTVSQMPDQSQELARLGGVRQ